MSGGMWWMRVRPAYLEAIRCAKAETETARRCAVALEQENAELRSIITDMLDETDKARSHILAARIDTRLRLKKLESDQ